MTKNDIIRDIKTISALGIPVFLLIIYVSSLILSYKSFNNTDEGSVLIESGVWIVSSMIIFFTLTLWSSIKSNYLNTIDEWFFNFSVMNLSLFSLLLFTSISFDWYILNSYIIELSTITSFLFILLGMSLLNFIKKNKMINSELVEANYHFKTLSQIDPMTNLYNRRFLEKILEESFKKNKNNTSSNLAVISIDIDNFKEVNDNYGHQMGDEVIRVVARVMLGSCRNNMYACRAGGEEFFIVLPNMSIEIARKVSEELRINIKNQCIMYRDIKICKTVSIGITEVNSEDKNIDDTLNRVDKALYHSKKNGKDIVTEL